MSFVRNTKPERDRVSEKEKEWAEVIKKYGIEHEVQISIVDSTTYFTIYFMVNPNYFDCTQTIKIEADEHTTTSEPQDLIDRINRRILKLKIEHTFKP